MSLPGKKVRDLTQLPTLSYEIKLNLPTNTDSNPQAISFLDLITNDKKFKNDKESLELVLSSYVKACGKQSVKEILAERDNLVEDNASLSDVIHALMDYNDQQNANLGVGYNDPDDDDSFIDDSTAAQDIIPRNMTNERDGFYINEKHQPIKARYVSESSELNTDEESGGDDSDEDDESSGSEKEDKQTKRTTNDQDDLNEKNAKKSKTDDDLTGKQSNTKRKRSISEVSAPSLSTTSDDKSKTTKTIEEPIKKVQKLSGTTDEQTTQNVISFVLPNEMDNDIKPSIEKLVKLITLDQTITNIQKKIERLFDTNTCRELLDLVKKLHRHTNAHRQLVFDILSSKTGICASILIGRARLLLLNDYEPPTVAFSLNELKDKLKAEVNRSLECHVQAHNDAIKEWQQKMSENPSKDKNRGPRKNFRLYKTINELIIRCVDRQLQTMTIYDMDTLELFLHNQIVPLWEKSGWMTAKKIISEVIRIEYRPLRDTLIPQNQLAQATRVSTTPTPTPVTAERVKKDSQTVPILPPPSQPSPKIINSTPSPTPTATKVQQQHPTSKSNDIRSSSHSSTNNNQGKLLEMATRVVPNPNKQQQQQQSSRPSSTESSVTSQLPEQSSNKTNRSDLVRPIAKPTIIPPSSQPDSSSIRRNSVPNSSATVIDLTTDLFTQYKKHANEPSKVNTSSSSTKDLSLSQRTMPSPTTSTNSSKQQQQQQQQQQFATKLPSEKSPAGSFLKEALLTGSSSPSALPSPKISASPLAVDNMINKPSNNSKPNTNVSGMKTPTTIQSPTTNSSQRPSGSTKTSTNRPSTELTHHRTDQQVQQSKTPSSSHRSQANISSPSSTSSSASPAARRSTGGFSSTHEHQSNRNHSSQVTIPPALSQALQWDPATLQLAAAALANPQLLNPSVFDPALFNTVFATAANMVGSNQSSPSSSSRQQHSQNTNNNRRS